MKNLYLFVFVLLIGGITLSQTSHANTNSNDPKMGTGQLSCMRKVVSEREAGLRSSQVTFHTALIAALDARAKAFEAAWSLSGAKARNDAIKSLWDTYQKSVKAAQEAHTKTREAARDKYDKDRKTCKVKPTSTELKSDL